MIQYDKDGVTLFYTDASGTKISASVFDGKKHTDMDTVMQQQLAAAAENAHAVDLYTQRLAIAQTSIISHSRNRRQPNVAKDTTT